MTSSKLLSILRDFVPDYHHAKFGGNWATNKGKTMCPPAYMVPKDASLNRVKTRSYYEKSGRMSYSITLTLNENNGEF